MRVCDIAFSETEKKIIEVVFQHLNNLYQNFYVLPIEEEAERERIFREKGLTKRETEIARLMMKGVAPINISQKLCISFTTVNKHIANMHKKLHVSTRQELIVRLHGML